MRALVRDFGRPATCRLGWGTIGAVGEDARHLHGTRAFLVTGPHLSFAHDVKRALEEEGLEVVVDDRTTHVPDNQRVVEGAEMWRKAGCDLLVSVGGGNAHDLAKGIGVVVANGGSLMDYEGVDRLRAPNPPHIAVNTTAGTGSELSHYTFITSHRKGRRVMVSDGRITPSIAINDPATHVTMGPALTATSGMNVLTHAVEAYLSRAAMPITDSMALDAIDLVSRYLQRAVRDGKDEEARAAMAQAEQLAGLAYNSAGLGLADAISLTLSAMYDVPHGDCNAVVLPYVLAYDLPAAEGRLADIGGVLAGGESGLSAAELARFAPAAVQALAREVRLATSLGSLGIDHDVAYMCAWSVLKSPLIAKNPRDVTEESLQEIFSEAVDGDPAEDAVRTLGTATRRPEAPPAA